MARVGCPTQSGAWLMATADSGNESPPPASECSSASTRSSAAELDAKQQEPAAANLEAAKDDEHRRRPAASGVRLLHPVLSMKTRDSRFRADHRASASSRAKRTLAAAGPFEVPRHAEFTTRLSSVLQVIYLVEGLRRSNAPGSSAASSARTAAGGHCRLPRPRAGHSRRTSAAERARRPAGEARPRGEPALIRAGRIADAQSPRARRLLARAAACVREPVPPTSASASGT